MSRKLNIFILFLIIILYMLFPENIKSNQTLVIKREECNGMMNSLYCDVLIEKKIGDEYILYKEYTISKWSDIIKVQCQNCRKREEERQ